jgi:hypothetical protein
MHQHYKTQRFANIQIDPDHRDRQQSTDMQLRQGLVTLQCGQSRWTVIHIIFQQSVFIEKKINEYTKMAKVMPTRPSVASQKHLIQSRRSPRDFFIYPIT